MIKQVNHPTCIVALDVGGTKIAGAVISYDGSGVCPTLLNQRQIPTDALRGGAAVLTDITMLAQQLIASSPLPPVGIGVGTAGCVDPATGAIAYANDLMPGWTGQPVAEHLREVCGLPVAVMGDVHAHALGEARWGAARDASSCLLVAAGTGLGGAFVVNGSVLRGFRGAAGHIGHSLHPAAANMPCACGHTSHVETVCSGTGIAALYQDRSVLDELDSTQGGSTIALRAVEGEQKAIATIEQAGWALGEAIGSWCNILDPETVILSGSVTKAGSMWRNAIDKGFASQILKPLAMTPIVEATLGDTAPLIGAAENLCDLMNASA